MIAQQQLGLEEYIHISARDFHKMCVDEFDDELLAPSLESIEAHEHGEALLKRVCQETGRTRVYFLQKYWMHRLSMRYSVNHKGKPRGELIITNIQMTPEELNLLPTSK